MKIFFKSICEKISLVFRFLNGLINIAVFYYFWIAALLILGIITITSFCCAGALVWQVLTAIYTGITQS